MKIRPFWVTVHRYTGLAMTFFLIVVGLTGSLLAFNTELDRLVNPQLHVEANNRQALEPIALIVRAERLAPEAQVESLWIYPDAAQVAVAPRRNGQTGKHYDLDYDQLIIDPYSGEELGRRRWGAISEGMINLLPFIYKLHFNLALDQIGMWALGITALVWTFDCFIGFYLTLPATKWAPQQDASVAVVFWRRWRRAWTVKWGAAAIRINFDLHRAGGLWVWAVLLVFAWSSVYMNLGDSVYPKVMQSISSYHQPWTEIADLPKPLEHPALDIKEACRLGEAAMSRAAAEEGFSIEAPAAVWINRAKGLYVYSVRSSADIQDRSGQTRVVLDANSGEQKMLLLPSGQYNGNTATSWLLALHMANVFGMPYRIFVCLLGLMIVMLALTGVVIWLKKQRPF